MKTRMFCQCRLLFQLTRFSSFGHHMNRAKPMFENAIRAMEEVIRPNYRNTALIRAARKEVASALSLPQLSPQINEHEERHDGHEDLAGESARHANPAPYIGVHVRRGDRRASAFPFYPQGVIPLEKFIVGARETWERFYGNHSSPRATTRHDDLDDPAAAEPPSGLRLGHDAQFPAPPVMWFASDSPTAAQDFAAAFPPATALFSLARSTDADLRALAPAREYVQAEFNEEPPEERVRLTRGVIVDLAMLSGLWAWHGQIVPGATVCMVGYVRQCALSLAGLRLTSVQVECVQAGRARLWLRARVRI